MKLVTALLLLALCLAGDTRAEVVVTRDDGGILDAYAEKYRAMVAAGEHLRIAGECNSACTLFTGIVPRERVCMARGAQLGFHSASQGVGGPFSAAGTRAMWQTYPAAIRDMIRKRGWNGNTPHPQIIPIKRGELLSIFKAC